MDELKSKKGNVYIIGCLLRPGALKFSKELEYNYFPPDTDNNEYYNIFQLSYANMPYYIIEIPENSINIAEKLAKNFNLKFVNGKPYSKQEGGFRLLCNPESCFTLETTSYENIRDWRENLREEQHDVCLKIKNLSSNNES